MDLFVPVLPSSLVEPCYGNDVIPLRGWWRSNIFVCEWVLPSVHCERREGDRGDDGSASLEMRVSVREMRWRKEMERGVGRVEISLLICLSLNNSCETVLSKSRKTGFTG